MSLRENGNVMSIEIDAYLSADTKTRRDVRLGTTEFPEYRDKCFEGDYYLQKWSWSRI